MQSETDPIADLGGSSNYSNENFEMKMLICYKLILTNYEGFDLNTSRPFYVYYQTYRLFCTFRFPPKD